MKTTTSDKKAFFIQPFPALNLRALSVETILTVWFCLTPIASFYIRFPAEKSLLTFDRLIFLSLALLLLVKKFGVFSSGGMSVTPTLTRQTFTATKFEIAWAWLSILALISALAQSNNIGYATKIAVDAFFLPLIAFANARRSFKLRGVENHRASRPHRY